ncbi:MAG: aminopeptidase [Geopsychrobacter sp.]|nr:aminopeptidase [Geopsychrobacter sp.]
MSEGYHQNRKHGRVLLTLAGFMLLLSACTDGGYYLQAARGQYEILKKRQPIVDLLQDKTLDKKRQTELTRILQIRDFASAQLGLPDNASYRSFVELDRPYPLWNLVAAPTLSLQPKIWCFPIAGCVSYRGYFSEKGAQSLAQKLQTQGYDTLVTGVPAYSTLSWFDDPVLSSFSHWPAPSVARLIIHELAHQQLYLSGDSAFNEAFATSVEIAGTKNWLNQYGSEQERQQFTTQLKRESTFVDWTNRLHQQLTNLYASSVSTQQKLLQKAAIFKSARDQYLQLKQHWGGYKGYDKWVKTLNNARLVSLQTYRRLLPSFNQLLAINNNDFPQYYLACKRLAEQSATERQQSMAALRPSPHLAAKQP